MKASERSLVEYIVAFALFGMLFLVGLGIIQSVQGSNIMTEITGNKTEEYVNGGTVKENPFPLNWVDSVVPVSTFPYYQLSEVGCEIAHRISDDMYANGGKSRQIGNGKNCQSSTNEPNRWCLVKDGAGRFRLHPMSGPTPLDWKDKFSSINCTVCEEGGNLIGDLDEICINDNLNAGSYELCHGLITVGSNVIRFGNNDCGRARNSAAWNKYCDRSGDDDFCNNNNDYIKMWAADKSDDYKIVNDNSDEIINKNPLVKFWGGNDAVLNTEQHEYIYC